MQNMSVGVAAQQRALNRPWQIRIECTDGHSKFWMAQDEKGDGQIHILWGKIGTAGQGPLLKDWAYVEKKVDEKMSRAKERYKYVQGTVVNSSSVNKAPAQQGPVLTGPYAAIAELRPVYDGNELTGTITGWKALDERGRSVMTLTADGGRDLIRSYPNRIRVDMNRSAGA